ncbi:MAG: hypothetical protein L0Y58_01095 [Verrucomicrobia subdivision 3 bacterium]|nr:hypothetical protein [Verrucomicrobiales bacterium]MCI0743976.1 hypothetical protein [Limisphaerales bacterium]
MKTETQLTLAYHSPAVVSDETFDGTWPFEAHYTNAPGFRMHYLDAGGGHSDRKSQQPLRSPA